MSRSESRIAMRAIGSVRWRLRSADGTDGEAEVIEAMATAVAVPDVRESGRVKVGWAVFAVTCGILLSAAALDVATGTFKTFPYLGVNLALALIAVLLTTQRPEHRISWVLAIMALWGTL